MTLPDVALRASERKEILQTLRHRRKSSSNIDSTSDNVSNYRSDEQKLPIAPVLRDLSAALVLVALYVDFLVYGFSNNTTKFIEIWDALATIAYLRDGVRSWKLRAKENQSPLWMFLVLFDEFFNYYCSGFMARFLIHGTFVVPSLDGVMEYILIALVCHFFPADRLWLVVQGYATNEKIAPSTSTPGAWIPGDPEVHQLVATMTWGLTKLRSLLVQLSGPVTPLATLVLGVVLCETSSLQHNYVKTVFLSLERKLEGHRWSYYNICVNKQTRMSFADLVPITLSSVKRYITSEQVQGAIVVAMSLALRQLRFPAPVDYLLIVCAYFGLLWKYGNSLIIPRSKCIVHAFDSTYKFASELCIRLVDEVLHQPRFHVDAIYEVIESNFPGWGSSSSWQKWVANVDQEVAHFIPLVIEDFRKSFVMLSARIWNSQMNVNLSENAAFLWSSFHEQIVTTFWGQSQTSSKERRQEQRLNARKQRERGDSTSTRRSTRRYSSERGDSISTRRSTRRYSNESTGSSLRRRSTLSGDSGKRVSISSTSDSSRRRLSRDQGSSTTIDSSSEAVSEVLQNSKPCFEQQSTHRISADYHELDSLQSPTSTGMADENSMNQSNRCDTTDTKSERGRLSL